MFPDTPTVSQLSHVIAQATAPAFLLGAPVRLECAPALRYDTS
jgi:hypothetical protein